MNLLRSRTARPLVGVGAVALVVGAVVVIANRGESLEPLSTAIAPQPTVVDLGETGDPLAPIEEVIDGATGQVDLWYFSVNPATTDVAALRAQPTTVDGVAGRSPEWFPVLTGGTAEVGRFVSGEMSGESVTYELRQTTAVTTSRSADDVVEQVTDAVADWWGEFRTTTTDDGDFDLSAYAEREVPDADEPASLHIAASTSDRLDDAVLVSVSAIWSTTEPLAAPPVEGHGDDLIDLADEREWPMTSWAQRSGWGTSWALAADELEVTWAAAGSPGSVADEVVARLGEPSSGDADTDGAALNYTDGNVRITAAPGATMSWRAAERWPIPGEPGPVRPSTVGIPLVDIAVEAADTPRGDHRPVADVVDELGQAGMIAVDGAVTSHAMTEFSATDDMTSTTAEQLMLVNTDLPVEEIAERVTEALGANGIDVTGGAAASTKVDNPAVVLDTEPQDRAGAPEYEIHIGESRDDERLTAIFVRLEVAIGGSLPDPPVVAEDYFTAARSAGDLHGLELSGWSLQYEGTGDGEDHIRQGDLAWRTSQRGDDALDAAVAAVTEITGVEPEIIDGYHHFDVDEVTWGVNVGAAGAYDTVRVEWSGGPVVVAG